MNTINEVSTKIIANINRDANTASSIGCLKDLTELVDDTSLGDQAGLIMMLLIPFIITIASQVAIKVMMRFAELYIMTAFASLPIAFLGHPDTKSMGISYLQKYAAVSLRGATLMLAVFIYSALNNHAFNDFRVIGKNKNLADWMFAHYTDFIAPRYC